MFQRILSILFFVVIGGHGFAQKYTSTTHDSLYMKAIELTGQYNSYKPTFYTKEPVLGIHVCNEANNSTASGEHAPSSNINSANPWNVQDPLSAIIIGGLNYLFFSKKRPKK